MQVLNLFLALLLNAFGGDAKKPIESNELEDKSKSFRLTKLIEWTKSYKEKPPKPKPLTRKTKASLTPQIMVCVLYLII